MRVGFKDKQEIYMQLHNLSPKHKRKSPKRIGRGGKRGTYSGRGIKGQKARAGRKLQPMIRVFIKRYPKLKGYRFKAQKENIATVNLDILEKKFSDGEKITPASLLEKRIIRKIKGKVPEVKILGRGKLSKKLIVEGCLLSKSAEEEIKKAGGEVK